MKRIMLVVLTLAVVFLLAVPAMADSLSYVTDAAGLLTQDQKTALESRAQELSEEYKIGIYIIAVQDYTRYGSQPEISDVLIDLFDTYNLGYGENRDAATFFISMEARDYTLDFNGDWGNYAFTEYARDRMEERILPSLKDNDWYSAFNEYLNVCQEDLALAQAGTPLGSEEEGNGGNSFSILFFLPGVFAAAITALVLVAPMHSAMTKNQADDYIVPGSMHLTRQSDHFIRRTVTRTPRAKEEDHSSHSSSNSSSHSYSSGSHSGRSGKF